MQAKIVNASALMRLFPNEEQPSNAQGTFVRSISFSSPSLLSVSDILTRGGLDVPPAALNVGRDVTDEEINVLLLDRTKGVRTDHFGGMTVKRDILCYSCSNSLHFRTHAGVTGTISVQFESQTYECARVATFVALSSRVPGNI